MQAPPDRPRLPDLRRRTALRNIIIVSPTRHSCSTRSIWRSCIGRRPEWRPACYRKRWCGPQRDGLKNGAARMRSMLARSWPRRCGPPWPATIWKPLGIYRARDVCCSSLLEYLAFLVNGEWQRMPLPRRPVESSVGNFAPAVWHRGNRIPPALRVPGRRDARHQRVSDAERGRYVQPAAGCPVRIRFDTIVCVPGTKSSGQALLQRQFNRMLNAGDFAVTQAAELKNALDGLTSNEFVDG